VRNSTTLAAKRQTYTYMTRALRNIRKERESYDDDDLSQLWMSQMEVISLFLRITKCNHRGKSHTHTQLLVRRLHSIVYTHTKDKTQFFERTVEKARPPRNSQPDLKV